MKLGRGRRTIVRAAFLLANGDAKLFWELQLGPDSPPARGVGGFTVAELYGAA